MAEEPTREHLARQLMLALYGVGRQADALEVYQQVRASLADELGLEPGPALKALQLGLKPFYALDNPGAEKVMRATLRATVAGSEPTDRRSPLLG